MVPRRLSPWSAAYQHAPEAQPEASGAVVVVEGHQVVLAVLAQPFEPESQMRADETESRRGEQPAMRAGHE